MGMLWTTVLPSSMLLAMDADEKEIVEYLKGYGRQFVSGKEIGRRAAGKQRYHDDPYWANQPLLRLVERGILETDSSGRYKIAPEKKKHRGEKKWIAPHLQKILEQSGKDFSDVLGSEGPDSPDSQKPGE